MLEMNSINITSDDYINISDANKKTNYSKKYLLLIFMKKSDRTDSVINNIT